MDLQILLDVPVEVARARMKQPSADRLERLGNDFFGLVREGYLSMARGDSAHWVVLDGTAPLSDVEAQIFDVVTTRLGRPPHGVRA